MDLRLPDMSGIDSMMAILSEFPEARIVMLTTFESDVEIQRALEVGARGYLLKSMPPSDLLDVIRQVHAGKKRIPAEVASQLAEHMGDLSLRAATINEHPGAKKKLLGCLLSPASTQSLPRGCDRSRRALTEYSAYEF